MDTKLLELEAKRRDMLLNAALEEFVTKGYDQASTNRIAKSAKMSKPLMFHYVTSKQELFLAMYDYFMELLDREYFSQLDFSQGDIFVRLQQSYLLQLKLIKQYPWILDFNKLSAETKSEAINQRVAAGKKQAACRQQLFANLDTTNFRKELDLEKALQFILWTNEGFTNQIVEKIKTSNRTDIDEAGLLAVLEDYLEELRKLFYVAADE
ncbi:TetR/AcrR family transcriptional regulator [Enterococcus pallens]|uniref:HTH tetR-type domain-containing protein n=1 Tax=Enterococcus pallens ATCC BAA-351 TaxID=1158607 RepID=R2T0R2_9ENTE|nr:TetR/AcrR family transcriptional regulator [Enterococcus pallens]EOH93844.1 hypothetical protein UAU_02540 [Enterococcus pallens ATCC BAA-351]EOU24684.1 hypothetical protein I588_00671 [Enterococcus pallens ATCC BAA-351]